MAQTVFLTQLVQVKREHTICVRRSETENFWMGIVKELSQNSEIIEKVGINIDI